MELEKDEILLEKYFEGQTSQTSSTTSTTTATTPNAQTTQTQVLDAQNVQATLSLQSAKRGQTAETGPGVMLYLLAPLAGYFVRKK